MKPLLFLAVLFSLSSCLYKMPEEDDYCLIPTVNNPDVTREKPSMSTLPQAKY